MKTRQLLHKSITAATLAGLLFTSSAVFAQVKIGSNPTVIGPDENLEIEATNGSKTTANKINGQFTVITPSDPVKFVGLQLSSDQNNRTLVVNPVDGVVKYASSAPVKVLSYQSSSLESFPLAAFGVSSLANTEVIDFAPADMIINTGAATLDGNIFTVAETGIYDLFAMSNIVVQGPTYVQSPVAGHGGMAVNLAIERQASGASTWTAVSGSRTNYHSDIQTAISCQTSALAQLNMGDKIRVTIFRGAGNYLTAATLIAANAGINGVPVSKAIKIIKIQ